MTLPEDIPDICKQARDILLTAGPEVSLHTPFLVAVVNEIESMRRQHRQLAKTLQLAEELVDTLVRAAEAHDDDEGWEDDDWRYQHGRLMGRIEMLKKEEPTP